MFVWVRKYFSCRADDLRYASCESNQSSVHSREPAYAQCLIMTCDKRDVWALLTKKTYVMLIDRCNTCSHLDTFYMIDLFAHFDQCLYRVESFACCRVQVDDDVDVSSLCNIFYILERCIRVHTESQPHMWWHKKDSVSSCFLRFFCHLDRLCCVLTVNTGDDCHNVSTLFCTDLYNTFSLCSCKSCDLSCMSVTYKSVHSFSVECFDPS